MSFAESHFLSAVCTLRHSCAEGGDVANEIFKNHLVEAIKSIESSALLPSASAFAVTTNLL